MTFKEKIMLAQKNNIFIPFDLAPVCRNIFLTFPILQAFQPVH